MAQNYHLQPQETRPLNQTPSDNNCPIKPKSLKLSHDNPPNDANPSTSDAKEIDPPTIVANNGVSLHYETVSKENFNPMKETEMVKDRKMKADI